MLAPNDIPFLLKTDRAAGGILGNIKSNYDKILDHLDFLGVVDLTKVTTSVGYLDPVTVTLPTSFVPPVGTLISTTSIDNAKAALIQLKDLDQSFFSGDVNGYDELGVIGNIYVNLNFLYQLSYDSNLESSDSKEKNEINLYKYVKNIIAAIQPAIGNINNFEVHVDPVDNKARVIDINFTKAKTPKLFELQVGNLKSVVRNYSLQSQIFPEQSSIVAIGSQAQGGQLGMQNNTMIDFNRSLIDRIIPKKDFGITSVGNAALHSGKKDTKLASNLGGIIFMFATLQQTETAPGSSTDISTLFNRCKSNLRDLIVYFQSITKSPGANRNIIPFKFSFEMDGIGGLVIGNLFTINQDILPNGYKGGGVGVKLAQTITGISHTIGKSDWITKIDALNIVLGNGPNSIEFKDLDLATLIDTSFKNSLASLLPPTLGPGGGVLVGPCGDLTLRTIPNNVPYGSKTKWFSLPVETKTPTTIPESTVVAYLKSAAVVAAHSQSIRRATYAIFSIESARGSSGVNNNYIGLQTDGGGFISNDTNYVKGSTTTKDSSTPPKCRAFGTYPTWQDCINHVMEIMKQRMQGGGSIREMCPTNPNDFTYFGDGYAANWVAATDPAKIANAKAAGRDRYKEGISKGI